MLVCDEQTSAEMPLVRDRLTALFMSLNSEWHRNGVHSKLAVGCSFYCHCHTSWKWHVPLLVTPGQELQLFK